jgi:hypothetical protein
MRVAAVAAIIARWFIVITPFIRFKFKYKARAAKALIHWLAIGQPPHGLLTLEGLAEFPKPVELTAR